MEESGAPPEVDPRAEVADLSRQPATGRHIPTLPAAADPVERQFTRTEPDRLCVTDIAAYTGYGQP